MATTPAQAPEERPGRRAGAQNGQLVPSKVLGTPTVFVEALDAEGAVVVERVESEVALLWPFVHKEVVFQKRGKTEDNPVQLPKQIGQDILALLLEYCRYHRFPGRSDKERKAFDERFIRLDTRRLCELTSAADSLDMKPLVDLSSRALARMIEGKTPEEIRETFHLPDDLTEEEKLEPVKNLADDPRIRLLNRLYAKKRKELAEKKAELLRRESGCPEAASAPAETRSVEELLSFIGEGGKGRGKPAAAAAAGSKKKKARRKKDSGGSGKRSPPAEAHAADSGEAGEHADAERDAGGGAAADAAAVFADAALDDSELDDEIEAFERSLNADWEERRAELIRMAGAYQPRPTRVTTLTSLSNFKARPLAEGGGEPESPSWESIWAEGPAGDAAGAPGPAEPRDGAANGGPPDAPGAAVAGGAEPAYASGRGGGAAAAVDVDAAAALLASFVERIGLSGRIRVDVREDGGGDTPSPELAAEAFSVEGEVAGLGSLRLLRRPPAPPEP